MYWPGPSQDSGNANCAMLSPAALSARSISRIASPRSFNTLADTVTVAPLASYTGTRISRRFATCEYPRRRWGGVRVGRRRVEVLECAGADHFGKEEHRTAPLAAEVRHVEVAQFRIEHLALHVDDSRGRARLVRPARRTGHCRPDRAPRPGLRQPFR